MGSRLRVRSIAPDAPVGADVPPAARLARLDACLVERVCGLEARRAEHLRMMQLRQAEFVQRCRPVAMLVAVLQLGVMNPLKQFPSRQARIEVKRSLARRRGAELKEAPALG